MESFIMADMKGASKIYKNFKYLNLEGLDLRKYENMEVESGMKALEEELLKRVKPGIKINDDVLDEIDIIILNVFEKKMSFKPWEEVNRKIDQIMQGKKVVKS